jgi:small-conductance mechanosensitive channel
MRLKHHYQQEKNETEEIQTALASLLTYFGFGVSICVGLFVAGFDFTELALIAGALSVGIGMGMQGIVNNFISGLILLIEKPIKPGDYINIGGTDGVVKKISVRSTQIITSAHEDIIIPNSDLVTQRLLNYTLTDKHFAIQSDVFVVSDSDPDLVKKCLLQAANEHDEVFKTGPDKPTVAFRAIENNKLLFSLYCLIKDAHHKTSVQSDIYFAIERILRENNVGASYKKEVS